jgi:hypothetical protein
MARELRRATQGSFYQMKNPHAVALGRKGGKAGTGKSKARTSEQARRAALIRWEKEDKK